MCPLIRDVKRVALESRKRREGGRKRREGKEGERGEKEKITWRRS